MNKVKVSVIVPIYNAGIHLKKCLESLSAQTLKELEIILVLDCPTDGSDKVAEEFAQHDARFYIVRNKENLHIGNSRNEGLKVAQGEYITFCDHDDYVAPNMYEILYKHAIDENLDLVCSPYIYRRGNQTNELIHYPHLPHKELRNLILKTSIGIYSEKDNLNKIYGHSVIWNKLFKFEVIKKNKIYFVDTKKINSEDNLFLLKYTYYSRRIGVVDDPLYIHILDINNTGSTIYYNSPDKVIEFLKQLRKYLVDWGMLSDIEIQSRYKNTVQLRSLMLIQKCLKNKVSLRDFLYIIKYLRNESLVVEAFKNHNCCRFTTPTLSKKILSKILRLFIIICN